MSWRGDLPSVRGRILKDEPHELLLPVAHFPGLRLSFDMIVPDNMHDAVDDKVKKPFIKRDRRRAGFIGGTLNRYDHIS